MHRTFVICEALGTSQEEVTVLTSDKVADHTWRDTGAVVDDRANSTGDALWDAATGKLYVASRAPASSGRLVRSPGWKPTIALRSQPSRPSSSAVVPPKQ